MAECNHKWNDHDECDICSITVPELNRQNLQKQVEQLKQELASAKLQIENLKRQVIRKPDS